MGEGDYKWVTVGLRFITNTSQQTRASLLRHLRKLGFRLEEAELFTAVDAARQWMRQRQLRPYCLVRTGKYRSGDEGSISGDFTVVDSLIEAVAFALGD